MEKKNNLERTIKVESGNAVIFEAEMSECISKVFERFGVPETLLNNMTWMQGLKKRDIPQKPELFESCLDAIFGKASPYLKKAITLEVRTRFGVDRKNFSNLKDLFDAARAAS